MKPYIKIFKITQRGVAAIVLAATVVSALSAGNLTFPRCNTASVGIVIRDLSSGKEVVAENADKFLTPASILKCVTSAATLLDSAENEQFETPAYTRGPIDRLGILHGDIVVKGVGDPSSESSNFPLYCGMADSIAAHLSALGVNRVDGRVVVDSSALPDQGPGRGWEYSDLPYSYGAGFYALNYHDNSISGSRSIQNPAARFATEITKRLVRGGIVVADSLASTECADYPLQLLYMHKSPQRKVILKKMMEESVNLYAEGMLRALEPGGSVDEALSKERKLISSLGVDTLYMNTDDGSGLSRHNAVTPRFMADMLERMAHSDYADLYVSLFPTAGYEGTVKHFLNGTRLEGQFVLKSGSLNGVHAYAGYKIDDNGKPTHAVVIIVNQFVCKRAAVKKAMTDFLLGQFPEKISNEE